MLVRSRPNAIPMTVCFVDFHPLAQAFVELILRRYITISVVDAADLRRDSVSNKELRTRLVFLIDHGAPQKDFCKYVQLVSHDFPHAKKIVLDTELSDDELCSLLSQGIDGFVSYLRVYETLPKALRAVAEGRIWVSARILEYYVSYVQRLSGRERKSSQELTPREKQIIGLLRKNLSNKEISSMLDISNSTVKFHLLRIFQKLGIHDRHSVLNAVLAQKLP